MCSRVNYHPDSVVNLCSLRNILNFPQPDRFQDGEVGDFTPVALQVKQGDSSSSKGSQGKLLLSTSGKVSPALHSVSNQYKLNADNTSGSAPSIQDEGANSMKEELSAADMVISKDVATGSLLEEVGTSNSSGSSEKGNFDSVGQETAKSMMTFLLPQAVPLLKKASKKKKGSASPSEISPCRMYPQKENNETDVPSTGVVSLSTYPFGFSFIISFFFPC